MGNASEKRLAKVRSLILRTLDEIIRDELKDPRLGMFTLLDARLARDLSYAEIAVSVLGKPEEITESVKVLEAAAPLLWNRLRSQTDLRTVPRLHFVADHGTVYLDEINRLIATLPKPAEDSTPAPDGDEEA